MITIDDLSLWIKENTALMHTPHKAVISKY